MTFENIAPARPRLMANGAAIERVKAAIAKDQTGRGQKLLRKMLEAADAIVAQPQITPASVPDDPTVRATTDILSVARTALQSIQMLSMAHLMTGADTYLAAA